MREKRSILIIGIIILGFCLGTICFTYLFCKEKDRNMQESTQVAKDPWIEGAPNLCVIFEDKQILAQEGTYSWYYEIEDGTRVGADADCVHPLQRKETMPCLSLDDCQELETEPVYALLQFAIVPDEVSVRCWSVDCWEDISAESEVLEVEVAEYYAEDGSFSADYSIRLLDESYVYEVSAVWNSSQVYGGDARYNFYTER